MRLHSWTCGECGAYHRQVSGALHDGEISIQCDSCGAIDRFRKGGLSQEATP